MKFTDSVSWSFGNIQGVGELELAALAMLIVTVVATGFPAYRAASIDPMRELRSQ